MEKEKLHRAMTILDVLNDIFGETRRKFIERQQKNIIYYLGLEYIPSEYKQELSKLILTIKREND